MTRPKKNLANKNYERRSRDIHEQSRWRCLSVGWLIRDRPQTGTINPSKHYLARCDCGAIIEMKNANLQRGAESMDDCGCGIFAPSTQPDKPA